MRRNRAASIGVVAVLCAALAACGSTGVKTASPPQATNTGAATGTASPHPVADRPLRPGEHRITVRMPATYTPSAPTGVGTDDYRCFLLDPKLTQDSYVTGFNVLPGNPKVVHHVILFRVPPDLVAEAKQRDAETKGPGWTCFGTSGLGGGGSIDDAPWLGAWAPGGSEQVYGNGLGEQMKAGSMIVMQVHYNLLAGIAPDRSAAELRVTQNPRTQALDTVLLPAPVELPCRPGHGGSLCDRATALADVIARFGRGPGQTANLLHLLCGGGPPGPVQSCTRTVQQPETIRGVAGHMHLLGKAIKIEVDPGTAKARTLLDITKWNFDDQHSVPTPAVHLVPGDTIKVTCRHSQLLRDYLPAFASQRADRYVMWGEGTTDEMCLGILLVTRP